MNPKLTITFMFSTEVKPTLKPQSIPEEEKSFQPNANVKIEIIAKHSLIEEESIR